MNYTNYIQVTATVSPAQPWSDLLIAELAEIGFESFEETIKGFKAWIPAEEFDQKKLDAVSLDVEEEVKFTFAVETINSQNWNQEWESNFEPVMVDGKCYIRAPFHSPSHGFDYEIVIEPKMSFGTGHHETTTLMVQWMLETNFKERKILDMGCGTGILAILASMMGAREGVAIDNFPYAWENTLENLEKNNITNITAIMGDANAIGNSKFDIILANITKNVLKEDMKTYADALPPGGELFISGFFYDDLDELVSLAKQNNLTETGHKQNKEWVAVRFKK